MQKLKNGYALTLVSVMLEKVVQAYGQNAVVPLISQSEALWSPYCSRSTSAVSSPIESSQPVPVIKEAQRASRAEHQVVLNNQLKRNSSHLKLNHILRELGFFGHSTVCLNGSIVTPTVGKARFFDTIRSKDEMSIGAGYAYQGFRGLFQISLNGMLAPTQGGAVPVKCLSENGNTVLFPSRFVGGGSFAFGVRGVYKDSFYAGCFLVFSFLGQRKLKDNCIGWTWPKSNKQIGVVELGLPAFSFNLEVKGTELYAAGMSENPYAKLDFCFDVGQMLIWCCKSLEKYPISTFKLGFQIINPELPKNLKKEDLYLNSGNPETSLSTFKASENNGESVFTNEQYFWTASTALTNQLELKIFGQLSGNRGISKLPLGVNLIWQNTSMNQTLGLKHRFIRGRGLSARERLIANSYNSIQYSIAPLYGYYRPQAVDSMSATVQTTWTGTLFN